MTVSAIASRNFAPMFSASGKNRQTPHKPRVVIVGNGIAGKAAGMQLKKSLAGRPDLADVTIIGKEDRFIFKPLLPDATNDVIPGVPMKDLFGDRSPVRFKHATVTGFSLAPGKRFVKTSKGKVPFDYLVYAPGSRTNYFNIPGAQDNSIPLEDAENMEQIKQAVADKLDAALKAERNSTSQGRNLSFVIAGAGATGVELAFEIKHYIDGLVKTRYPRLRYNPPRVTLVERENDILPGFSNSEKKHVKNRLEKAGIELLLNSAVTGVTPEGSITLQDISRTPARDFVIHTVKPIWVTGVRANPLNDTLPFEKGPKNKIVVNPFLQVPGEPNIFAVGDAAAAPDARNPGRILPDTGQVAEQAGKYAARQIVRMLQGKMPPDDKRNPFVFKDKGVILATGPDQSIVRLFNKATLKGRMAHRLRKEVYRRKMAG